MFLTQTIFMCQTPSQICFIHNPEELKEFSPGPGQVRQGQSPAKQIASYLKLKFFSARCQKLTTKTEFRHYTGTFAGVDIADKTTLMHHDCIFR
jgi:hypothetical protein